MKKRVLSLFMALALCFSMPPTAALATENTTEPSTQLTEPTPVPQEPETPDQGENTEPSAAEKAAPVGEVSETADSTHKHYLCGGDTCNKVGHDENTKTTFTAWTDTLAQTQYGNTNVKADTCLPQLAGNYYLTKDVTLTTTWKCNDDVKLCLNGYSITATANENDVDVEILYVADGKAFTLTDCNSSKSSKKFNKNDKGRWVQDDNGTNTVNGGAIFHQSGKSGPGVNVPENGTFTMYGGTICGNINSYYCGGGVDVSGTFNMYGGTICGNIGTYSGGVYVQHGGTFNMSGDAAITGNGSPRNGGGVYMDANATMNVSGNVQIKDNWKGGTLTADSGSANNLHLYADKTVTIGTEDLVSTAKIGVTTAEAPTFNWDISIATGAKDGVDYEKIFTPDVQNQGYGIIKIGNNLYLSGHQHSWGYTLNADKTTITATCHANDCPYKDGGSVTINKPLHEVYGDGKSAEATLTKTNWTAGDVSIAYKKGESPLSSAPTNAGTYTASITVTDKSGKNTTASVEYTIAQATYTGATTANGSAIFGTEGTVDLSALIVEGGKLSLGTATDTNRILDGNPTVEGKTLKFKFNNSATADQTATVPVKVTNIPNYNGYDITVTLTVTDKDVPTLNVKNITKPYDGKEVSTDEAHGAATFSGQTVAGTWSWKEDAAAPKNVVDSGIYTIVFKPTDTTKYAEAQTTITVTINKALITVTALNKQITVGQAVPDLGEPKPNKDYTVTGLVGNDQLGGTLKMKYQKNGQDVTVSTNNPGSYDIVITGVATPTNGDNYTLKLEKGTLTIQAQSSGGSSSGGGGFSSGGFSSFGGGSSSDRDNSGSTGKVETTTKPDGTKVETTTAKDGSTSKTTTNPNGSSVTENKAADGSTGTVKIVDNSKDFIDTRNHWAKDEINFVASRELFKGVTEEHFGVERMMTRAMVNTVLARLAGVDTTPAAGQNWYDKGIRVSELRYITVEAALAGRATITLNCNSPVTRQKVTRRYK